MIGRREMAEPVSNYSATEISDTFRFSNNASNPVFLDLAGTLVEPLKPERLDQITWIPGDVEAIAQLSSTGFVCLVVTVQSRIAKGLWSLSEFEKMVRLFCSRTPTPRCHRCRSVCTPHRFAKPCPCKKPSTLLYDRAASEHQLNPIDSFVIGDSPDDVRAARRLGTRGCLVRTGWAADPHV
jgi:D-glycero-D-manno-heptose 1,7-bisphosphate phosphatase